MFSKWCFGQIPFNTIFSSWALFARTCNTIVPQLWTCIKNPSLAVNSLSLVSYFTLIHRTNTFKISDRFKEIPFTILPWRGQSGCAYHVYRGIIRKIKIKRWQHEIKTELWRKFLRPKQNFVDQKGFDENRIKGGTALRLAWKYFPGNLLLETLLTKRNISKQSPSEWKHCNIYIKTHFF